MLVALSSAPTVSFLPTIQSPSCVYVIVVLFGAGPGVYFDFAGIIFHVPRKGSAADSVITAASIVKHKLRAIFIVIRVYTKKGAGMRRAISFPRRRFGP